MPPFAPAGAGAPTAVYGTGFTVARTSAGLFTVTLANPAIRIRGGTVIGAAHAGWRGLAAGVIESTMAAMGADPSTLLAWLGPAIGSDAFEVYELAGPTEVVWSEPDKPEVFPADVLMPARAVFGPGCVSGSRGIFSWVVFDSGEF